MASAEIRFDSKRAEQFFDNLRRNVKSVTERENKYVSSISPFVYRDVIEHFEAEKGPKGRWRGWSKIYRDRMIKRGKGGNKILQDSGRLRNTFKPTNWRKSSEGLFWYNNAKTKSGFPYAFAHDTGGPKLPKREFMWLSDKAMKNISKVTAAFFTRGL